MTDRKSTTGAFVSVTTLFFAWGFITSLIDPLVAAMKGIFSLSNVEAQLTTFAFFIAYGAISIPAALLIGRLRAASSIVLAVVLMVVACLGMMAASTAGTYSGVLVCLFVLASGITILQVAANPLAAVLGPPERSHARLTLSQALNSLGTVLGPLIGAHLLLRGVEAKAGEALSEAARQSALGSIDRAFLAIAVLLALLAGFLLWSRQRITDAAPVPIEAPHGFARTLRDVAGSRWALIGGLAIFLYVGAEVAIGSQMALFLASKPIWNIPLQEAGYYVSLYWLGAMFGRFAGSVLLTRFAAHRLLATAAVVAGLLCLFQLFVQGIPAGYAALAIGLFNSIMFPVIFTLTLERSTASSEATSGFLCTAIIGGALVPLLVGKIADVSNYSTAFVAPLLCYAVLAAIARSAGRASVRPAAAPAAALAH